MTGATITIMKDHRRFGIADFLCQLPDVLGWNAGFGLGPLRGIGVDESEKLIESFDPASDIRNVVVKMFLDQRICRP